MNREESAQTKNIGDKKHSLKDLKNIVYKLAGVSTTKSLKRLQSDFKSLDFRRRSSWDKALKTISKTNSAKQFEDWRQNPPDEYKDLFSDIDNVSESYNQSIEAGLKISKSIKEDAKDLQKLSDEFSDEARELNDDATTVEIKKRKR